MSDLARTTVSAITQEWVGQEVMVGCYPTMVILAVDQLPVMGRTYLYTTDGFYDLPGIAPVVVAVSA